MNGKQMVVRVEQVGFIVVDSGTIMVADPSYTLPDDGSHRTDTARNWSTFLQAMYQDRKPLNSTPLGKGIAIVLPTAADGCYAIYAEKDQDGIITRITVDLEHRVPAAEFRDWMNT